jgi:cation diffusion facilitator CzcD-associated flavoprotein CzcO
VAHNSSDDSYSQLRQSQSLMASSTQTTEGQARVAIIGTGLAGLTTAHLLHNDERQRYSVTLFEQVRPGTLPWFPSCC